MEKVLSVIDCKMKAANREFEITNAYRKLTTDEERVIFTLNIMSEYEIIPRAMGDAKNAEKSRAWRELGNKSFIKNPINDENCLETLKLYSKSIAYAPPFSVELALAYANRSALSLRSHKYTACLKDIERALKLQYPDNLKGKLYVRKMECLAALGTTEDLGKHYEEALYWLEKVSIKEDGGGNKERLAKKLKDSYDGENSSKTRRRKKNEERKKEESLPVVGSKNQEVPCASDAIAIRYSAEFGRHVSATRDIRPGEVLAVEKAYSLMLSPNNAGTHCFHCLEGCWANIPCDDCTLAMYCSEECKAADRKMFHDVECPVIPALLAMDFTKLDFLGLRVALKAVREANSWQELKKELAEIDDGCCDPRSKGFSKDGIFDSDKYRSFYSLVKNTEKRSAADLFRRSLDSCFITYFVATESELFGERLQKGDLKGMKNNDFITFFGGLVLGHQQSIPSNGHSFSEERGLESVERGIAAMPFLSLFNHSCDPNVSRQSRSGAIVVNALYPIKKGEQIFDNYGQHYAMTGKSSRKAELLKQYYFDCRCRPCTEDWPNYFGLKSFQSVVKNSQDKRRILMALGKLDDYMELARSKKVLDKPSVVEDLLRMVETLYECGAVPCLEMNNVVETIKRIWDLGGNKGLMFTE